ncbi:hypothetical protein [Sphingobacterium faecium]|uniref:hypothetical protein n=1 Tax=Sphingobacterium faecium TaxID=34087 RepID=UPI00320B07EA
MLAPIKLPGKALQIIKYIALGLGVMETVLDEPDKKERMSFRRRRKIQRKKKRRYPMKVNDICMGTLGGVLCSIYASFSFGDLMQTALMAVVSTLVSYVTSRLLGKIKSKMK